MKYLLFIFLSCITATAYSQNYEVGGRILKIPHPDHFYNYLGENKDIDRGLIRAAAMSNNRVLATFCSKQDLSKVMQGKFASPNVTYSIQVDTRYEPIDITVEDFQELKKQFKEAYENQELLKQFKKEAEGNVNDKAERIFGKNIQLKLIPTGIVGMTTNSFTYSAFAKMHQNGEQKIAYVIATNFLIDGKLINLNQTVRSPENIEKIDASYLAWIDKIEGK